MSKMEVPFTFTDAQLYPMSGPGVIVNPGNILLPARYKSLASAIYNFKYKKDDILLLSYPKSGTTWAAEILWAMAHIDELEKAYTEKLCHRVHWIDNDYLRFVNLENYLEKLRTICPNAKTEDGPCLQLAALDEGPRIIWSHLPLNLQNPSVLDDCKVVYVVRHPKDTLFSRFVHINKTFGFNDILQLAENYMSGPFVFSPLWPHINEAWKRKDHPNLHIIFYEDMKADIITELQKLSRFLGLHLDKDQLQRVKEHTSFNNMKANPTMVMDMEGFDGNFFNKGQVGASKGVLPPEVEVRVDAWVKDNALKVDPSFKYAF